MLPRYLALVSLLMLTSIRAWAGGDEAGTDADEQTLRAARLPTESPSLLALFRKRTPDADTQARIKALIAQLGSELFAEREEASEGLAEYDVAAAGLLRKAAHHNDLEIRWRARDALALIEQNDLSTDVLIAALRVLGRRKPLRTAEVLLDYAPHAGDADILEEVCLALASAAVQGQPDANPSVGPDPRLVRALADPSPIKRAVAGAALSYAGSRTHFPAVRRLLRDPDLQVRRRIALALLDARDKAAVPVLIDLLAELPLDEAEHVESMLLQLARDTAPKSSLDDRRDAALSDRRDAAPTVRSKYRDAWAEWWKQHRDAIDLAKIELSTKWRGFVLAVCMTTLRGRGVRSSGCLVEFDSRGRTRWQMKGLFYPVDAQVLDEKHVLVTEYSPGQVTERNRNGDIVRRISVPDFPLEARRLPNGNTLITTRSRVFEVDRNDKEVWTTNLFQNNIVAACPLRGGEIGICLRNGEFVRLDRDCKTLASFRVGRLFRPNGTHIQGLPNGHVLIPLMYDNKVVEFDKDGREVWSIAYPRPKCAQRLPNGRTLIASYGSNVFAELDKKGHEVKTQRCGAPLMSVRGR